MAYESRRVLATHKSLTTKRDFSIGIEKVIDGIQIEDPVRDPHGLHLDDARHERDRRGQGETGRPVPDRLRSRTPRQLPTRQAPRHVAGLPLPRRPRPLRTGEGGARPSGSPGAGRQDSRQGRRHRGLELLQPAQPRAREPGVHRDFARLRSAHRARPPAFDAAGLGAACDDGGAQRVAAGRAAGLHHRGPPRHGAPQDRRAADGGARGRHADERRVRSPHARSRRSTPALPQARSAAASCRAARMRWWWTSAARRRIWR